MKAVLVIDMPAVCGECSVRSYCMEIDGRKKECPLKPMPSKRKSMIEWLDANVKSHDLTEYDKGWNDCVDFLKGDMQDD